MAEQSAIPKGELSPDADSRPREHQAIPNPLGDQQGIHNYFVNRLQQERDGAIAPSATSADPVVAPDQGQPPAVPQQTQQPEQRVDDTQQPGDAPQPPADQPNEPDNPLDPAALAEDNQEDPSVVGIDVDGKRYTAAEIKDLVEEAEHGGLRLDDYKRKTQYLSRVRQEHEALGTALNEGQETIQAKEQIIDRVLQANLAAYENADTSQMDPQQFEQFKRGYAEAKRGADALRQAFQNADAELEKRRGEAFDRKSASTVQMLRWHEPRWNDEFYGQVRNFAVNEGLMTAEGMDRENDFLKILGLVSMMDRAQLPETIVEQIENPKPPQRQRNQQQPKDSRGRFTTNVENSRQAVLSSGNARGDGSLRNHFMANLEKERQQQR
jgi:hypothetical protein